MSLKIASNLELPHDAVTQTFGILAKRGAGKTYTGSVMVEEMLKAKLHVIVVDPIGVWWGLRTSANGKREGLEIIIAGGEHADIPITPDSGETLADLVVEHQLSIVIDVSLFRKNEQIHFMTDFAETLYRRNRHAVHLVLDEADAFAPQRPFGNEARLLGAIEDIVRRGRARGIGVTMITQRPAVLNKNVLTQIEVLVVLRLTSPQDRAAIGEWVKMNADPDQAAELLNSLQSLPVGTAWIYSPGWLDLFKKVHIRKRETLDSSSTPKAGQAIVEARAMAKVDLADIRTKLAATIEKVEAENPKALRKQVADLQHQLANQKPDTIVTQVEVLPEAVKTCVDMVRNAYVQMGQYVKMLEQYMGQYSTASDTDSQFNVPAQVRPDGTMRQGNQRTAVAQQFGIDPAVPGGDRTIVHDGEGNEIKLGPGESKILIAAGQYPKGVTRSQLTILTGYKRSSRNTYISRLSQAGLVEVTDDSIVITESGIARLGNNYDPLPTGKALRRRLLNELPTGERAILQMLVNAYPESVTRDAISEHTDYSRSSRNTYLSRMSAREIVDIQGQQVKAAAGLFEGSQK